MASPRVVIAGGEGPQVRATVNHLLEQGRRVSVLTDALRSAEAPALRRAGADVVPASLRDPGALEHAFAGADGLVLVLDRPEAGPAERLRQAKTIAAAALRARIPHIVFAAGTGPDHHQISCDLGNEVEREMRRLGLPVTVLRPATIMEEIPWYWLSRPGREVTLAAPYPLATHLPMISLDDVGALSAIAIADPETFSGKTVPLAADTITLSELAELLSTELHELVTATEVQVEGVFMITDAGNPVADIEWLRSIRPTMQTVAAWLRTGGGAELCRRRVAAAA